jgi:hypothetical protein
VFVILSWWYMLVFRFAVYAGYDDTSGVLGTLISCVLNTMTCLVVDGVDDVSKRMHDGFIPLFSKDLSDAPMVTFI